MIKKKGFTMVEVIIVLRVFSTALIIGINAVNNSSRYLNRLRQQTIALNIAREGIESMYQIRDTNRRRRSSQKDQCRLKADPLSDEWSSGCDNDPWIGKGHRVIQQEEGNINLIKDDRVQGYSTEERGNYGVRDEDIYGNLENERQKDSESGQTITENPWKIYQLHNIDGEWIDHESFSSLNQELKNTENKKEWNFYRVIRVQGLYSKDGNSELTCSDGSDSNCGDSSAKELRFCSTIIYTRPYQGMVNICSIMTNFQE